MRVSKRRCLSQYRSCNSCHRAQVIPRGKQRRRTYMTEPRIEDIPSIRKLLEAAKSGASLAKWVPRLNPFLKLFGLNIQNSAELIRKASELREATIALAAMPDHFNDLFGDRGWVIYESFNVEVAQRAIAQAEAGDWTAAESTLVNYYTEENISFQLLRLAGLNSFRPRRPLARKAKDDYLAGRYYASVPVVLALLDGFVNELGDRGFFARDADLKAWDSIAAHEKGLQRLARIFTKGRYKTTTDQITVPYRNGILHGMDLGYDNQIVAAKCWAALFATGDWARKIEKGEKQSSPEPAKSTWSEIFKQIGENSAMRAELEAWRPRDLVVGQDMPEAGTPDEYIDGSPERALVTLLRFWQQRNYGKMAEILRVPLSGSRNEAAGYLRELYDRHRLREFQIETVRDAAAAATEITARCRFDEKEERVLKFYLVYENESSRPVVRDTPGGHWSATVREL